MRVARLRALTLIQCIIRPVKVHVEMRVARLRALTLPGVGVLIGADHGRNEGCPTEGTRINMKTKSSISSIKRRDAVFLQRYRSEPTDKIKRYL